MRHLKKKKTTKFCAKMKLTFVNGKLRWKQKTILIYLFIYLAMDIDDKQVVLATFNTLPFLFSMDLKKKKEEEKFRLLYDAKK